MTFPHYFWLFGHALHPHPVMEALAYAVGFTLQMISRYRRREFECPESAGGQLWLMVAALAGALLGAKLLALAESPSQYAQQMAAHGWSALLGGKTIVGGLLGGWIAVEIAKKCLGVTRATGDAWVMPLIASIAIGRIGCFLTGLSDDTYGTPTTLPWGVDFGDHIRRHPTQIYEIIFVLLLAPVLCLSRGAWAVPGMRFRLFILAYTAFRLLVDFLKPEQRILAGMSAIQIACLLAMIYCVWDIRRRLPRADALPRRAIA